jgi:transposase
MLSLACNCVLNAGDGIVLHRLHRGGINTVRRAKASGYQLLQRFRALVAKRDVPNLEAWLTDATTGGLAPFVSLANAIRADYAAVKAALTTEWSNGPVEGHVHRVKLIKRQGYGRMSFALLRRRVLEA